jgi:D-alanyl-D-alanine carboxypeptidase
MRRTEVPAVSIAVVLNGKVTHVAAYGIARLEERIEATPSTRFGIGSISKQFVAAAVLLLCEEGRLSLDDNVSRWFPGLTQANEITVRQLLSHTSGYRDYWPQDYVTAEMKDATTADAIVSRWAKMPLDFQPGAEWQYSNTNYSIAGRLVEKVSGEPLMQFLQTRIFGPLNMNTVTEADTKPLSPPDAAAYTRYGLGPIRPASKEAPGWLYSAGNLAMTAHELALWDISLIDKTLLSRASYEVETTGVKLNNGSNSGYALGLFVSETGCLWHFGGSSGFRSANLIWPEQRAAVVVLTNCNVGTAVQDLIDRINYIVVPLKGADAKARELLIGLQHGTLDRSLLTSNANEFFTDTVLRDIASSLSALGTPEVIQPIGSEQRGGMQLRMYRVRFARRALLLTVRFLPDGQVEQLLINPF